MIFHPLDQNTPEWKRARIGIATASCFDKIITPSKWELSKSSMGYIYQLLSERTTGENEETFTSYWMERGQQYEGDARDAYCFATGYEVAQGGFFTSDDFAIGASPDVRVFVNGVLKGSCEIKCPKGSTQIETLLRMATDPAYFCQTQGQMYVMETEFVDFVSYHPDMPIFKHRTVRNDAFIEKFEGVLGEFFANMALAEEKLQREYDFIVPPRPIIEMYDTRLRAERFENDNIPSILMAG